jgi:hypothetical protein
MTLNWKIINLYETDFDFCLQATAPLFAQRLRVKYKL